MSSYAGPARELERDLQHPLAVEGHPRGAVGLFERAAAGQRRGAVEDADVVQPEEAALEEVAAVRVLAVDPPGEVGQQALEDAREEVAVALAADLGLALGRRTAPPTPCTGGLTSPKFHSYAGIWPFGCR